MNSLDLFVPVIFILGMGFLIGAYFLVRATLNKGSKKRSDVDVDQLMGGDAPPAHSLFGSNSSSHSSSHTSDSSVHHSAGSHDAGSHVGATIVGGPADAEFGSDGGHSVDVSSFDGGSGFDGGGGGDSGGSD